MAKCPACKSKRVYKGYRLAPLPLRLVRIHEFLCEDCNLQFRAFSLLPPRTRRRKNGNKKHSHQAHRHTTEEAVPEAQDRAHTVEKINAKPIEKLMVAQAPGATSAPVNRSPIVPPTTVSTAAEPTENVAPQQWQMSAQALEEASARHTKTDSDRSSRSHRSHQVCPHCGATDTERRRRKMWEKMAFAFTTIRAYNCRICGGDFYAKRKQKSGE